MDRSGGASSTRPGLVSLALGSVLIGLLTYLAPSAPADPGEAEPSSSSGMRAYKDPVTGRLGAPPPGSPTPLAPSSRARASSLRPETRPGRTSAGGTVFDSRYRYWSSTLATKQSDGRLAADCVPGQEPPPRHSPAGVRE